MSDLGDRRSNVERRATHEAAPRKPRNRRAISAASAAVVLAVAGACCFGYVATHQTHFPEPALSTADTTIPASLSNGIVGPIMKSSLPTAITIPAIHVSSPVMQLGVTATNEVEVPAPGPDYNHVGWYKYSAVPGTLGPAVLVGHIDSAADGPSVFFELGGLHAKDLVRITRADGSVAVYSVDSVKRFEKSKFPTAMVYGNTDHAALRLVTCGGPFDNASGHYRDNIIVFASLVSTS